MEKKIIQYIAIILVCAIFGWVLLSFIDVNLNNVGGKISSWNMFPILMKATESWRN